MTYSLSRKAVLCLSAIAATAIAPQVALAQDNEGEVMGALSVAPADLAAALLAVDGTDAEAAAIQSVSGSDYAQLFYGLTTLGMRAPDTLGLAGECEVPLLDGYEVACSDGLRLYAGVDGAIYENGGGIDSAPLDATQYGLSVGADMSIGDSAVIGGNLAYMRGDADGDAGLDADYDGWRIGGYGTIDNGYTYFQLTGSYGQIGIDADRSVEFPGFAANMSSDVDVEQLTLGAHAGVRFAVGHATMLPYANVDYVRTAWDSFSESGGNAGLRLDGGVDDRLYSTLGMRFNSDIGTFVASANLGWRRQFKARRNAINSYYLGTNAPMEIVTDEANPDSALAGISIGGKAGKMDVRAYYDAIFNGHETTHGFGLRLRLPLGG